VDDAKKAELRRECEISLANAEAYRAPSAKHEPVHMVADAADILSLMSENKSLWEALDEIANPLTYMRKRAGAKGLRLGGMAHSIANSVGYLQGIARAALSRSETKGGEE
jgi:hypothetical protein